MLLWTIQHETIYKALLKSGFFVPDSTHGFMEEDFQHAYDWLCGQMRLRLPNTPENAKYPIWAWYQWEGTRKRPDMRTSHKVLSPSGTPIVLLTLEVPDEEVLLSDFDMWHSTLGNHYLALTEEEDNVIGENATAQQKRKSWEHILTLTLIAIIALIRLTRNQSKQPFGFLKRNTLKRLSFSFRSKLC